MWLLKSLSFEIICTCILSLSLSSRYRSVSVSLSLVCYLFTIWTCNLIECLPPSAAHVSCISKKKSLSLFMILQQFWQWLLPMLPPPLMPATLTRRERLTWEMSSVWSGWKTQIRLINYSKNYQMFVLIKAQIFVILYWCDLIICKSNRYFVTILIYMYITISKIVEKDEFIFLANYSDFNINACIY